MCDVITSVLEKEEMAVGNRSLCVWHYSIPGEPVDMVSWIRGLYKSGLSAVQTFYPCSTVVSVCSKGPCRVGFLHKWKNHFYKMKGDVGMSGHEKERKQEDAYTKIQTHS